MTARSRATKAYVDRLRAAGGKIIAVRMTAAQLEQLNRLRLPGESASACVNRLVVDRHFLAELNRAQR